MADAGVTEGHRANLPIKPDSASVTRCRIDLKYCVESE